MSLNGRPLRLVFVYGKATPLDPHRSATATGAGIISALHSLTRILASHSHDVTVVGRIEHPAVVDGVTWWDRRALPGLTTDAPPDALIVIPDLLPLLLPVPARRRLIWSGNAFANGDVAVTRPWPWAEQLGRPGERARLWPVGLYPDVVDTYVVKSRWQADQVNEATGFPLEKMVVIHNGVPDLFFVPSPEGRQPARIVYTSQARRGLSVLLELFPTIRAAVPDAELHVFGYDQANGAGPVAPSAGVVMPGVVIRGAVDKRQLAAELHQAAVYAYPCTFNETFCTSVAEGQAAGLPVVATARAALTERVDHGQDGYLVAGPAAEPRARQAFVDAVVRLLRDDSLQRRMGEQAAVKARQCYSWDAVALQWERQLLPSRDLPVRVPSLDGHPNLLTPELLHLSDRGVEGDVPAAAAEQWLRDDWASYGFDAADAPVGQTAPIE
jgi:glycosyltransferase involved in cell wall biosynthesis